MMKKSIRVLTIIILAILFLAASNAVSAKTSVLENLAKAKSEALKERDDLISRQMEKISKERMADGTPEMENLAKAKAEALKSGEDALQQSAGNISKLMEEISGDRIADNVEMIKLVKSMEKFQKDKKKFDKELKVYSVETRIDLGENFHKALRSYSTEHLVRCRDSKGEMKLLFAEVCGKDVRIVHFFKKNFWLGFSIFFGTFGVVFFVSCLFDPVIRMGIGSLVVFICIIVGIIIIFYL